MNEQIIPLESSTVEIQQTKPPVLVVAKKETVPPVIVEPGPGLNGPSAPADWHAEAGRKGAHRVHQLMELGLLYEKEHGLKRGRQRLRQLIQEGKVYEQEHGLSTKARRSRRDPLAGDQLVQSFFRSLLRMVKPAYRDKLSRILQALDQK